MAITADVLAELRAIVGPRGCLELDADKAPYLRDERELFHGRTPMVLQPASCEALARCVRVCARHGVGIVAQGGNTGYMGGSIPDERGEQVLISTRRLNRIRAVDPINYTMVVEAGCVLADVQSAALEANRLFPLSLGAEGTCHIGGNLSTNAGGTAVLRYGNARELVLGLEVVLPNGEIWDGLRGLRKDNTGYDLKQVFLGAEGTLGIITAAVLKLFPRPRETVTALVALSSTAAAPRLLASVREATGDCVSTFEYLHRVCMELVTEHIENTADPFDTPHEHYALVELASSHGDSELTQPLEGVLGHALEAQDVRDAVIAASETQRRRLWRLREAIPEAQKRAGGSIKHDVSVTVSKVPEFLERASALVKEILPAARVTPFGHIGDGNIHFNLTQPSGSGSRADRDRFQAAAATVVPKVHDLVHELGGSFSAEHGIGQLKTGELNRYKSSVELELMRKIKKAMDPQGIMNPGKVLTGSR